MSIHLNRAKLGAIVLKIVFVLCVFRTLGAWAQTAVDGAIGGRIVDPSGAAVVGVTVQTKDIATGLTAETTSDHNGEFLIARLPASEYQIAASAEGFNPFIIRRITVELGSISEVQLKLKLADISAAITVTAESTSPEESSSSAISSTITEAEIEQLPVNGRQWQTFAILSPTVNPDHQGENLLSFRGLAVTQNSTQIDGANDDQSFGSLPRGTASKRLENEEDSGETGGANRNAGSRRHSGAAYTFSQAAVREFRVSGQNYSALYGHAAGGVVTTVSKSGTNTLHGTASYLLRTSALGATNPFSIATTYVNGLVTSTIVKPHDLWQQFVGSVGGAAVQDKLFYFYTYDQQRHAFPAVSAPGDPGFYSLTPTQLALLGNRGVTRAKVTAALNYLNSLTGPVKRRSDQTINFGKLDWQVSAKNRISVQYNRARSTSLAGVRSAPVVDRGTASLGNSSSKVDAVLSRWLWLATPHLSQELRFQYGRDFQFEQVQAPLPQEPTVGPGGYAPEVAIGPSGLTFGTPASLGRGAYPDERRIQFADMVTWTHGHHLLQVGADLSLVHDYIASLNNAEGTFHYDSGVTNGHAGGLVDWITDYTFDVHAYPNGGCPSINSPIHNFCFTSFTQSFGQQAVAFDTQEWAGFVQDSWRVRPNLTVNTGLRYDYELEPLPQHPNVALDAVFGQSGATSVFPEDRNNFSPRVGVDWEPFGSGHGVVRLGYGLFYGRLPGATIRSALVNTAMASSTTHVRITPSTITACPQVANQGFGYACAYLAAPPAAVGATTSATVFDRRFRLPSVQQGSLTIEREVGAGVVGSATYLMNLDRQLSNSVDINIAPSTAMRRFQIQGGTGALGVRDGEIFAVPVYTERVSTSFGTVSDVVSNANASYNALVLEARRRNRKGLEFRASWTWAKAIDYGQSSEAAPRANGQFDPFSVQYDKGLSRLNFPHKVVVSAVWEPKLATEQRWLRMAANGWMLSSIFRETSGRPYSFDISGGPRLSGGRQSINGSGGAVYLPTVGRNTLRLPDTSNLDLRVSRAVRVTERVRMRGVAEVFNVANRVNYSGITQRAFLIGSEAGGVTPLVFQDAATVAAEGLNVRPFGTRTEAASGSTRERQVQLGLRVEF
ncbi:MAG: Cna protein B-type domain protein [Edaphobacter sp.]|nr:Cna protein B-type domain protein [Edaphobacter sp.]